jgi:CheY-like chemotaxis protein
MEHTPITRGGAARRILVVDDNRDWADCLSRLLRNEGYSVHTSISICRG